MAATTSVKHVVVDSGGFIRNAPIREIGDEVYTVPEVVHESCDKATRQRLQVLPYTLNMKKPSAEAIVFVGNFARKTGDYKHLSEVDIHVLALTYMLEKQHVGVEHIKSEPVRQAAEYIVPSKRNGVQQTLTAGFYLGNPADGKTKPKDAEDTPTTEVMDSSEESTEKQNTETENTETENTETERTEKSSEGNDNLNDVLPEDLMEEGEDSEEEEEEEEEEEDDDGDDEGWITPSNIKEVKRQMGVGTAEAKQTRVAVACLTTDFAMQNVLIQMGLNVVSVDGMLIKRAKSYVLRCFACMKISYNTMKVFCPNCGNKTLKRVAMTRDEDGKVHYYISRRPLNTKGMKFPLPTPKGGKHANNPLLCADQPMPQQRLTRKAKQTVDVFDPDFVAGSSPFAVNDVTSRASKIGITGKHDFRNNAYWNKRNPNEPRKRNGRKK